MLLDQYARPLKRPAQRDLQDELTAPSTGSVRQIMGGHPADNLRPERLAAILRDAEVNDPTNFLQMAEQFEEKDLHYGAVLGVRKRAVRKLDLVVKPGDDSDLAQDAAEFVRSQLNSSAFRSSLIDIMDAIGKGFSVHELIWDLRSSPWKIVGFKYRDPSWFKFDIEDGETLRYRDNDGDKLLQPGKFLVHRAKTKSGLTIRGGLARLAAWAYIFKNYTLRDWSIFLTTYGHPVRFGSYDTNATPEDKQTLLRAVRQIGTDMAAIIPKSMELEFINGAITGGDKMFENSARYWDEQLSKSVLGQVGTTDAIAGGHAVGKIHEAVRADIRDADGEQLATTIERDIATYLTAWNFGPEVACPTIGLVAPEEHEPRLFLAAARQFGPLGLQIPMSQVREQFGFREPEDGEDVLTFAAPAAKPPKLTADLGEVTAAAEDRRHETVFERFNAGVEAGSFSDTTDPIIQGFVEALEGADTLEEARDILAELADTAPPPSFQEFMARIGFAARLAGETGADIEA